MLLTGTDADRAALILRLRQRALRAAWARAAILGREPHVDTLVPTLVQPLNPLNARMALRTNRLFLLPLHSKVLQPEALRCSRLSPLVGPGWPEQLHPIVAWTAHQEFGIHVAAIYDMDLRQQLLLFERRMDWSGDISIGDSRGRGFDMRNQRWCVVLARLCEMHFVSDPAGAALLGQVSIRVIRRTNEQCRGRQILG